MTQDYTGKRVILKDKNGNYLLPYIEPIPVATPQSDGLMSSGDKIRLNSLDNSYASQTLYQKTVSPSNFLGTITCKLTDNATIFNLSTDLERDATVVFDASDLIHHIDYINGLYAHVQVITFEVFRPALDKVDNTVWPSNVQWLTGEIPTIEKNNAALYAFRSFDGGASWIGNLQCTWQSTIPVLTFRTILDITQFDMSNINNWVWAYVEGTDKLMVNGTNYYPINFANNSLRISGFEKSLAFASGTTINYSVTIHGRNINTGETVELISNPFTGSFTLTKDTTVELTLRRAS